MLDWVLETPEILERHWERARRAEGWKLRAWPRGVAVLGMGGSGVSGLLLEGILKTVSPVPVAWLRDLSLPRWLSGESLVVACSYSGGTWETLCQLDEVRRAGIPWVGLSSGGRLRDIAQGDGAPWLPLDTGRAPRSMSGAALVGLLALFSDLAGEVSAWVGDAVDGLREDVKAWSPETPDDEERATTSGEPWPHVPRRPRALARLLYSRLPLLYGFGEVGEAVAYRWQCQLAENGKTASHAHRLPELLHNEVVAWEDWSRHDPRPIVLHIVTGEGVGDEGDAGGREALSGGTWDRVWNELRRTGLEAFRIPAEGGSLLERSLRQIFLGDAASTYVALERGVEPTPVRSIERLKGNLPQD
jgi:glucose/mannose-6-phosphate isomerase